MPGEKVTVVLDAQAVAGLLDATSGVQEAASTRGLDNVVTEMRAVRLALTGALRSHGWTPTEDGNWIKKPRSRRVR